MSAYDDFVFKSGLLRDQDVDKKVDYYLAGLVEEVGEVSRLRRKELRGRVISPEEYLDELGDVLWYLVALLRETTDKTVDELMVGNMRKLEARHKTL